ncbi:hypothetical protein BZG35_01605 [Brevundimonas sp. LM2]|uniref:hypothetical protein n=1 Tax=Brevundimonas sp. LM2 TaxID=1938605 RepID=UPI000983E344|nr:hypothetical protein [Brevundimonas sp. LM2]AQR60494.1 hypothetical protein BZG35_01605 [Brevundimonas sp. LM2]
MTKSIILGSVTALALVFAGAASAQQQTNLGGSVAPVCFVNNLNPSLNFANIVTGAQVTDAFDVRCNDVDGATMSLTSAEGHLESDDFEDQGVGYNVNMSQAAIGLSLSLAALVGINDISNTDALPGSFTLASGVNNAAFTATLAGNGVWAGGYSDTLTVDITAN